MKNKGWALLFLLLVAAFLVGYPTGQRFPVHHYERLNDAVLFDPTTGRACVVFVTAADETYVRPVPNKPIAFLPACPAGDN
ncbi:MAG: hypothetical protein WAN33_11550 [Candidatus Acidiferrales bacterium]